MDPQPPPVEALRRPSAATKNATSQIRPRVSIERVRRRSRVLVLSRPPRRVRNSSRRQLNDACPQPPLPESPSRIPQRRPPRGQNTKLDVPRGQLGEPRSPDHTAKGIASPAPKRSKLSLTAEPSPTSLPAPAQFRTPRARYQIEKSEVEHHAGVQQMFPYSSSQRASLKPDHQDHQPPSDTGARGSGSLSNRWSKCAKDISNSPNGSRRSGVNQLLVEAVARNIALQLQLLSLSDHPGSGQLGSPKSSSPTSESAEATSRTSSQRRALDRFTQELERYAQHTGAKGKLPVCTPTPTKSNASLRTVSALLPYRQEFRAAGLAITSKDQAKRPATATKSHVVRQPRWRPRPLPFSRLHLPQVDGNRTSLCTNTGQSFADFDKKNGCIKAVQAPAPRRKRKITIKQVAAFTRCLSCFPHHDDQMSIKGPSYKEQRPEPASPGYRTGDGEVELNSGDAFENPRTPPPLPPLPPTRPPQLILQRPSVDTRVPVPPQQPIPDFNMEQARTTSSLYPTSRPGTTRSGSGNSPGKLSNKLGMLGQPSTTMSQQLAQGEILHTRELSDRTGSDLRSKAPYASRSAEQLENILALLPPTPAQNDPPQSSPGLVQDLPPRQATPEVLHAAEMPSKEPGSLLVVLPMPGPLGDAEVLPEQESLSPLKAWMEGAEGCATKKPQSRKQHPNQRRGQPRQPLAHAVVTLCSRACSIRPAAKPNIPKRVSSMRGSEQSDSSDHGIVDRDILRGLHVTASAACDERIDAFIRHKTGFRIRRFLADLMSLENLGDDLAGESREKKFRRRRAEMKKLKRQVRSSRRINHTAVATTQSL